jgi:predicted RNA-binding protein with PIN domain
MPGSSAAPTSEGRKRTRVRRGRAGGRYHRWVDGLSTSLVRPALELACAVAREGERRRPPVPVPGPMRPLLRFSRLPERALATVRGIVEDDDEFRGRVAAVADEEVLGRVPWLWLVRPDGWADELASATAESAVRSQLADDQRADRSLRRRVALLEAALWRTEAELGEARAASARLSSELTELRQERRAEIEAATRDRAASIAASAASADANRRADEAECRRAAAERQLDVAEKGFRASEAANATLAQQLEEVRHELILTAAARAEAQRREVETAGALGEAVGEAATAATLLGQALTRAAQLLDADGDAGASAPPAIGDAPSLPGTPSPGWGRALRETAGAGPVRQAARLPAAVFDDSSDAAAWLMRLPQVVLIVDGYNVTLAAWAARELADQRHRLVSALAELSMRTGAQVEVVFDGADDHAHPLRSLPARRAVRVTFSPPAVDADEVIIERVAQLPPGRPVVVATDDRRVRDECARAGANLLSTEQLVTLLGRGRT